MEPSLCAVFRRTLVWDPGPQPSLPGPPSRVCNGCPAVSDGQPGVGRPGGRGIRHLPWVVLVAPLEFPGQCKGLGPSGGSAIHRPGLTGVLQATSGRGPLTHALLCPSLGTPWTPSHSAGLWVLGPGLQGQVGTGTVPGAPRGDSTPLLLLVGKQRYGEVRRLARGPVAQAADPSVLEPPSVPPTPLATAAWQLSFWSQSSERGRCSGGAPVLPQGAATY